MLYKENSFLKSTTIFIVGIVISIILAYYVKKENDKEQHQEFEVSSNDIRDKIENRLSAYVQFSRTSSSFFMSSDTVTRSEWNYFFEKSKISENLIGFQGLAYLAQVSRKQLSSFTKHISRELNDVYEVFPETKEAYYTPIIYIEPAEKNEKALGFNSSSNSNMRNAIEIARDSNKVTITDKVILVQEVEAEPKPGIVIYAPVYNKNLLINTIEQRREAIKGWVAISLRMHDFMDGVMGDFDLGVEKHIGLKIFDNDSLSNNHLLYDSQLNIKNYDSKKHNLLIKTIQVNTKKWLLQFSKPKTPMINIGSVTVFLIGLVISLLLSLLMFSLFNTVSFGKSLAKKLTLDLSDKNIELKKTNQLLNESYSDLKKAKEKVEESEDKLKLIANNLVNGMLYQVVSIDENKRKYNYVSDAVYKFYGCTAEEVLNNPNLIYDRIHKDDIEEFKKNEIKSIKEQTIFKSKARVINPDGSIRWSYYVSRPRIIDGLIHWDGIEFDITEQKKIENELLIAKESAEESNKLKTEFLNNMSHEIRTPMNGILGFSDLLNTPNLSNEKKQSFIGIIQSSAKQLLNVIDDILEISILETKQVKIVESKVCLNELLVDLFLVFDIKSKENKTPIYLKKGLTDKQSTIFVDKTKLVKVISNLIENALKFTSNGYIEIGYVLNNEKIDIHIKDTGIGIDKEKHELIFERFSQAEVELSKKVGGLGLGLSIVKENVELLDGKIRLESIKNEGSTFIVSIPYKPVFENKPNETNNQPIILIAEDEEVNYLYVETLIKDVLKLDYNVIHAKNGQEAVEMCRKYSTIELVLMDLKMPIMNGYEALKEIKKIRPDLTIVAQTAYSTTDVKNDVSSTGFDDFISKPINSDIFAKIIEIYLK